MSGLVIAYPTDVAAEAFRFGRMHMEIHLLAFALAMGDLAVLTSDV